MLKKIGAVSEETRGFDGNYLEIPANPTNLRRTPMSSDD